MRLFLYGTLIDGDVRAGVLGPAAAALALRPARAPGWRAVYGTGRRYPFLVRSRGALAPGMLAEGVGPEVVGRLAAYEGPQYRLGSVDVVADGAILRASAFLPRRAALPGRRRFTIERWRAREKETCLAALAAEGGR